MTEYSAAVTTQGHAREVVGVEVSRSLSGSGARPLGLSGSLVAATGGATLLEQADTATITQGGPWGRDTSPVAWPPQSGDSGSIDVSVDGVWHRRLTGGIDSAASGARRAVDIDLSDDVPGGGGEEISIPPLVNVPPTCWGPTSQDARRPRIEAILDRAMRAMGFFTGFRHGRQAAVMQGFQGDVETLDHGRTEPHATEPLSDGVAMRTADNWNGGKPRSYREHPAGGVLVMDAAASSGSETMVFTDFGRDVSPLSWGESTTYFGPSWTNFEIAAVLAFELPTSGQLRYQLMSPRQTSARWKPEAARTVEMIRSGATNLMVRFRGPASILATLTVPFNFGSAAPVRVAVSGGVMRVYQGGTLLGSIAHAAQGALAWAQRIIYVQTVATRVSLGPCVLGLPEGGEPERRAYLGPANAKIYPSNSPLYRNHFFEALPEVKNRNALDLFTEISNIYSACSWVDETGVLIWAHPDRVARGLPHLPAGKTILASESMFDIAWEDDRDAVLPTAAKADVPWFTWNYDWTTWRDIDGTYPLLPRLSPGNFPTKVMDGTETSWVTTTLKAKGGETWYGFPEGRAVGQDFGWTYGIGGPRAAWLTSGFTIRWTDTARKMLQTDVNAANASWGLTNNVYAKIKAIDSQTVELGLQPQPISNGGGQYNMRLPDLDPTKEAAGMSAPMFQIPGLITWTEKVIVREATSGGKGDVLAFGRWVPDNSAQHPFRMARGEYEVADFTEWQHHSPVRLLKQIPIVYDPTLRLGQRVTLTDDSVYLRSIDGIIVQIDEAVSPGSATMRITLRELSSVVASQFAAERVPDPSPFVPGSARPIPTDTVAPAQVGPPVTPVADTRPTDLANARMMMITARLGENRWTVTPTAAQLLKTPSLTSFNIEILGLKFAPASITATYGDMHNAGWNDATYSYEAPAYTKTPYEATTRAFVGRLVYVAWDPNLAIPRTNAGGDELVHVMYYASSTYPPATWSPPYTQEARDVRWRALLYGMAIPWFNTAYPEPQAYPYMYRGLGVALGMYTSSSVQEPYRIRGGKESWDDQQPLRGFGLSWWRWYPAGSTTGSSPRPDRSTWHDLAARFSEIPIPASETTPFKVPLAPNSAEIAYYITPWDIYGNETVPKP